MTVVPSKAEVQYVHLARFAWDLHAAGMHVEVHLTMQNEPTIVIPRATEPLRIMAIESNGQWFFTWARGQRMRLLDDRAIPTIRKLVDVS